MQGLEYTVMERSFVMNSKVREATEVYMEDVMNRAFELELEGVEFLQMYGKELEEALSVGKADTK